MRIHLFAGALAFTLAACGGNSSSLTPATPSTPAPAANPTPTPDPNVAAYGCPLPPKPDLNIVCPKVAPRLADYVTAAIDRTISEHPEYFDLNDVLGSGYKVRDYKTYTDAVVGYIRAQGVCAVNGKEEVGVKNTNDFHEQYNIWTSSGYVRRPPGAYITTCIPAQF